MDQRRLTIIVTAVAFVLLAIAQYLTWRESGRMNPGIFAMIAVLLVPLTLALRKKP
jgi:hypothetical protein